MNREGIFQVLSFIGDGAYHGGARWIRGPCPLAHWKHSGGVDNHPSFGIEVNDTGASRVRCYSCGFKGDGLGYLVDEIALYNRQEPVAGLRILEARQIADQDGNGFVVPNVDYDNQISAAISGQSNAPIPEDWLSTFPPIGKVQPVYDYMTGRGFSGALLSEFDVRASPVDGRACFPIRDADGRLRGLVGRTIHKDVEPRYYFYPHPNRNVNTWFNENRVNMALPVVVTEGAIDCMSIARVYPNVLGGLMSVINVGKKRFLSDAVYIVTMFDTGKGGSKAREQLGSWALSQGIPFCHRVPQDDAGAASIEELQDLLYGVV